MVDSPVPPSSSLPQKAYAIVNERAGGGAKIPEVLELLAGTSINVLPASDGLAAQTIARRVLSLGADLIVAVGGDGSVASAANVILESGQAHVALGIIPLGTGNDLARTLGIPLDPAAALQTILDGMTRSIDVVAVTSASGNVHMLNMATGGSSTTATKRTTSSLKRVLKAFSYLISSWRAFGQKKTFRLQVEADGVTRKVRAWNVMVANGRTAGGGFVMAPAAEIDDGLVDVVIVKIASTFDILRMIFKLLTGRLKDDPSLIEGRYRAVTIEATPSFQFSVDGEVKYKTPVGFQVIPRALRVICPKPNGV